MIYTEELMYTIIYCTFERTSVKFIEHIELACTYVSETNVSLFFHVKRVPSPGLVLSNMVQQALCYYWF